MSMPSTLTFVVRFGFGARRCLGQYFADRQLRAVVYHLLDSYKVTCSDYSGIPPRFKIDKTEYVDRFSLEFLLEKRKEGSDAKC